MTSRRWTMSGATAMIAAAMLITIAALPGSSEARPGSSGKSMGSKRAMRSPSGLGGALIYPLWTVTNTNTLVAITNTSIEVHGTDGVASAFCPGGGNCPSNTAISVNSFGTWTQVHFHVRRDTNSQDLKNWKVCLSPGDVWTMSLVSNGSGGATIATTDLSTVDGVSFPATIAGATQGYIEAIAVDVGTTEKVGCDGQVGNNDALNGPNGFTVLGGGPDSMHEIVNSLFGEGLFVSLGTGLASGYNATAIAGMQELEQGEPIGQSVKSTTIPESGVASAQKRAWTALTHPGLDYTTGSLASRWIADSSVGFDTQLVVTFPVSTNEAGAALTLKPFTDFGLGGSDVCAECLSFNFGIPSTMALWLRDDEEGVSTGSPKQVTIGKETNVLSLNALILANPALLPPSGARGGWLHLLIDADENEFVDAVHGVTCSTSAGSSLSPCATVGSVQHHFVPAMLPVAGFTILQGTQGGTLLSALLPWKELIPYAEYQCFNGSDYCRIKGSNNP